MGLSLNKTKTIILSSQHYRNYVQSQLGLNEQGDRRELREIEVYYDPYSDTPEQDYENLRDVVRSLDVESLLNDELNKGQPDTYLISKISQTLDFQEISDVLKLLKVFLSAENLHSFRSSWSTIMRTTAKIRGNEDFASIFNEIDDLLDGIITHSKHLLVAETSILFFLKTLRFKKTNNRAQFLNYLYSHNSSISIKRGCIECWGKWTDRSQFIALRNTWEQLHVEEQKMLWLVAKYFHDDGFFSQKQLAGTLQHRWALGLNVSNEKKYIVDNYITWAKDYE